VFDKTGTLTTGRHEVTHVHRFDQHEEAEIVGLAAIAEKMSEHPVAGAIMRKADALNLQISSPTSFRSHAGRGVEAQHNGQRILVGQGALLSENRVEISREIQSHSDDHQLQGHTTLMVAHDGKTCGTICVSDQLRDKAEHAVADLKRMGIEKVVMLTGDNEKVAMNIAGRVGIEHVSAGILPEQKAAEITRHKANGQKVAMVGDGVNDAPALATADVGVAMGVNGTDVANEAAHIALMADDLSKVAFAVGLARRTIAIIKQGLVFALVYNVIMITTAMHGNLGLIGGAIAHQISSVAVILNSMRLLRYKSAVR
jgi:P-type E1-E2 ATPase